jgi:L-phenylalanine/L-methionine N-acetyltransferase
MDIRVPPHTAKANSSALGGLVIRAAEPSDAAEMSALLGSPGVFEGTLQTPYAAVASRIDMLSKIDPLAVRLVAIQRDATTGVERMVAHAGLFASHTSLRRMHARSLAITVGKDFQGQGVGDRLMHGLLDWADNWAGVLRTELTVFTDNALTLKVFAHGDGQ